MKKTLSPIRKQFYLLPYNICASVESMNVSCHASPVHSWVTLLIASTPVTCVAPTSAMKAGQ